MVWLTVLVFSVCDLMILVGGTLREVRPFLRVVVLPNGGVGTVVIAMETRLTRLGVGAHLNLGELAAARLMQAAFPLAARPRTQAEAGGAPAVAAVRAGRRRPVHRRREAAGSPVDEGADR